MKYWVIADTHFGHGEMVKYCGRPEDFTEIIKRNLIDTVKVGDVLIHLGDVCIGNDNDHNVWFTRLGTRNILVKGNHDGKSPHWYMRQGWAMCVERFDFVFGTKRIAFTHVPAGWDGYFDLNVHGHLHNANHRRNEETIKKTLNGYHRLIAMELEDYRPVLLDRLIV